MFVPAGPIFAESLFDGRLSKFGIREQTPRWAAAVTGGHRCLTDGKNFLCIQSDPKGFVEAFVEYSSADVSHLLAIISDSFEYIVSTYELFGDGPPLVDDA